MKALKGKNAERAKGGKSYSAAPVSVKTKNMCV